MSSFTIDFVNKSATFYVDGEITVLQNCIRVVSNSQRDDSPAHANLMFNGKYVNITKKICFDEIHLFIVKIGQSFAYIDGTFYHLIVEYESYPRNLKTPVYYNVMLTKPIDPNSNFGKSIKQQFLH